MNLDKTTHSRRITRQYPYNDTNLDYIVEQSFMDMYKRSECTINHFLLVVSYGVAQIMWERCRGYQSPVQGRRVFNPTRFGVVMEQDYGFRQTQIIPDRHLMYLIGVQSMQGVLKQFCVETAWDCVEHGWWMTRIEMEP
jgi:hypothetical protein